MSMIGTISCKAPVVSITITVVVRVIRVAPPMYAAAPTTLYAVRLTGSSLPPHLRPTILYAFRLTDNSLPPHLSITGDLDFLGPKKSSSNQCGHFPLQVPGHGNYGHTWLNASRSRARLMM